MKFSPITLLLCLAGMLSAQPDCLRTQTHGIESTKHFHTIVWVCTGDTLSVVTDSNGVTTTTIDGFWITTEEVTRDLWRWYLSVDRNVYDDDLLPAVGMSHEEIERFLDMLSKSTRLEWRLPTREEWLFAFRGGIFGDDHIFAGSNHHNLVAWSKANSGGKIHTPGERIPNDLNIYDMSGNVAEMVTDGDSILFLGGCYLDDFGTYNPKIRKSDNPIIRKSPIIDFPMPPTEARGLRIVAHEPLKFNTYCERIFK